MTQFEAPPAGVSRVSPVPASRVPEASEKHLQPAGPAVAARVAPVPSVTNPEKVKAGARLNFQAHELIRQQKFAEAVPLLQQAVAMLKGSTAPEYPYALFNLAQALRLTGKPKEALPLLDECLKIIPNQDLAKQELAKTYQSLANAAKPQ